MNPPEKTLLESKSDYLQWIEDKIRENNYDVVFSDDPEKYPCVAMLMVDDSIANETSAGTAYYGFIYPEDFKTYN